MLFKNTSEKDTVRVNRPGHIVLSVKPGETCEVADVYAMPRHSVSGGRSPSIIEMLAPQLRPADEKEHEEWSNPTQKPKAAGKKAGKGPQKVPDAQELVAGGMSPGAARSKVAKIMAENSLLEQAAEDGE